MNTVLSNKKGCGLLPHIKYNIWLGMWQIIYFAIIQLF